MEKLLSGLSDEDRDIILRYYWDDQAVDKIAKDYGVSSSSIYSRMSRARSRLKKNVKAVNYHKKHERQKCI